jgi:DNA-binding response OmpR family regulator
MRIAVVEDDSDISEMMTIVLEEAGHQVSAHPCGSSLLRTLFPGPALAPLYDLVILDLNLPDMAGIDVIVAIRQAHEVPPAQLPIVVCSASPPDIARVAAKFPAISVVRKPFPLADLYQAIATAREPQGQRVRGV